MRQRKTQSVTIKEMNFHKVAIQRTNDIINKISSMINFNNKQYYEYSEEEINKIFDAIENQLHLTKNMLLTGSKRFTLDTKKTDE